MATTKNITMKQFNGTDYDTLYPKTDVKQIENLTPSSIGAVSKSGDTMTGDLSISKAISSLVLAIPDKEYRSEFIKNATRDVDLGTIISDVSSSSGRNYSKITICNATKEFSYQIIDSGELKGYYNILHTGNAQTLGFPKIAIGSYVGTGTYGSTNPNSLTFDFEPKILFIASDGENAFWPGVAMIRGQGYSTGFGTMGGGTGSEQDLTITWSGNTVTWYTSVNMSGGFDQYAQMNTSGKTFRYVALG